jgi:hypothetical protein
MLDDLTPYQKTAIETIPKRAIYPVRPLAERIAGDGILDAANIGAAANSVRLDPRTWEGWAPDDAHCKPGHAAAGIRHHPGAGCRLIIPRRGRREDPAGSGFAG